MKHYKGKKQIRDSKNKVTKTCRKETFYWEKKKHPPKRNWQKSEIFLGRENKEERCPFLCKSCRQRKNTKRKVNEKGGKTVKKKRRHQKKEKFQKRWQNWKLRSKKKNHLYKVKTWKQRDKTYPPKKGQNREKTDKQEENERMVNIRKQRKRRKRKGARKRFLQRKNFYFTNIFLQKDRYKKKWLIKIQKGISLLAQAISCSNMRGVCPVHELFWFCLVQVSTTQFCSFPSFLMARVSDGTVMPISPAPASSSNMGSPDGSLPDLEGTGFRASTME